MAAVINVADPADPRLDDFRDLNSVDRRPDLPTGKGLVIAELETPDDQQEIVKPDWLGSEVTGDPRYFNVSLVQHPYSKWAR